MEPPEHCQACQRAAEPRLLRYRRGAEIVENGALLQCDVCERFACSDCLGVYDIVSGYDFLCHACAAALERARDDSVAADRALSSAPPRAQIQPDAGEGRKEIAASFADPTPQALPFGANRP